MKRFLIYLGSTLLTIILALSVFIFVLFQGEEFGGSPLVERASLLKTAPNFRDDMFHNTVEQRPTDFMVNLREMMGDQKRTPPAPFPQDKPKYEDVVAPGLRAVWFGHATVLVEIDGKRVIFDPMLSQFAIMVHHRNRACEI